ncbi:RNA polymerase sigma factor [Eubacteriales bacterium OttesenSCG-928-N13]|nr:RNA polymerase sigma factor [Eubacteriales bacterium OttesenSCG-928-N13]
MRDMEQMYIEQFQPVYRFVLSLCRDPAQAEEITQQTFFKAIKAVDRFDGRCTLRVWLCQIAKNLYFDESRKRKRQLPIESAPTGTSDDVEAQILRQERARELHGALHLLPEPYKEVFSLRVFAELPHAEIAQLFHKSESWARVTYYRAKLMLMNELKGDETDE